VIEVEEPSTEEEVEEEIIYKPRNKVKEVKEVKEIKEVIKPREKQSDARLKRFYNDIFPT
jgi:hypothetical protein